MESGKVTALASAIGRFATADGAHDTPIRALMLHRRSAPSDPMCAVYEPSLCVIAQGAKRVLLGDEVYRYDPARYLLCSADVPVSGQVIEASAKTPYLSLCVTLDPATVAELAAQIDRRGGAAARLASDVSPRALSVAPAEAGLLDALVRLVQLLESPSDDQSVLAPLVLREITYRLLTGEQGARLRRMATGDGQGRRVVDAVRWLREHFAEPLRIESLAREVRLSPSALHQQFKSVTAMSPLQYQKLLRLQEARRLMLADGLDAATACFRVGYESPSQFSREYKRLFGAPPRRDVEAMRDVSVDA
jgi:AraC-like DNA-binding protein